MPFIEIKQPIDYIRIKNKRITICYTLIKYFKDKKVKIFHDGENHLIGLKPDKDGYKLSKCGNSYTISCIGLGRIVQGEYYPKWDEKEKMLIFKY